MGDIIYAYMSDGEFVSSPYYVDDSLVVRCEYLGEPERFIFQYKIILERSYIFLHDWKFGNILLEENKSFKWKHIISFTIESISPNGLKETTIFVGAFPLRRFSKRNSNDDILAVITALYLIVLTGNPVIAKKIYEDILTPYYIPEEHDTDMFEYYLTCLIKLEKSYELFHMIKITNDKERHFYNHIVSLYKIGFDDYFEGAIRNCNMLLCGLKRPDF